VVYCLAREVITMRLYLVQDGEARSELEDPERSLTARGNEETRRISDAAKRRSICPAKICHSRKKRAEQTATIIAAALDRPAQMGQGLNPNDDIQPWVEGISAEAEDLMIVGHCRSWRSLPPFLSAATRGERQFCFATAPSFAWKRKKPKDGPSAGSSSRKWFDPK
jgi:phosphohistidine phosphatase SixA